MKKIKAFNKPSKLFTNIQLSEKQFLNNAHTPLDLDIGAGVGFFAHQYALQNKERRLIAIERTKEKFQKLWRRFESHQKPYNLLPIHADALLWAYENLENHSVDRCFIFYPNPYPKKKDLNKRFYAMPIFGELLNKIKLNGEIILHTNEGFYLEEAKLYFTENWELQLKAENTYQLQLTPEYQPKTHFEKKYFLRGIPCYQLCLVKINL